MKFQSIDIFCHVVDNFGDIGVVYRFARVLHQRKNDLRIRVFVDDLRTFSQINPQIAITNEIQTIDDITYISMHLINDTFVDCNGIADVLVEAFGCEIPQCIMSKAYFQSTLLLNLEYLSAEKWVEGYHLKESLLPTGTLRKFFFMPGFTDKTGGLIIDSVLPKKNSWPTIFSSLCQINGTLSLLDSKKDNSITGTIFTYLRNFRSFVDAAQNLPQQFYLLIFGSKSREGMMYTLKDIPHKFMREDYILSKNVHFFFMPFLPQEQYDQLLYHTDFNIVRGEDSLARAILSGKPFVWNAYLQDKKYQKVKVEAFCEMMKKYFEEDSYYSYYRNLLINFNDIESEDPSIKTTEQFTCFFENLNKFEHSTKKMCYFIRNNCNLVDKFITFIENYNN